MFRFAAVIICSAACFAQSPQADVDQALRARITEFYQDHVDGKFRQAEALVAEDTKDYYYSGNKPKFLSFEILRVEYSDNYTRAKVTTNCEQYIPLPEFAGKTFKLPMISYWKVIDGQWYWYIDPDILSQSPFGKVTIAKGTPSPSQVSIPNAEDVLRTMSAQVKADKDKVTLKPGGSAQVTITNGAPGPVSISLMGKIPGVDIKLDRMNIPAGEKAVLTFRAGDAAKTGIVSVLIEQTNQVIPIQVKIE
jgi:hypothetical protein